MCLALPLKKSTVHVDSPAPLRTRKASLSESIDLTASPLRRTTRAMSNERDMTSSPVPMRSNRRSAMTESEDDSTVDLTTPGRKPRKSIRKSTAIDFIKEEPEEETASEFNESKEMNQTVIDELELRTRSISKSPSTSLSPQKTPAVEKASQESLINFSALEEDDDEKVEKPGKIFKHRSQFSKNKTSEDKGLSFNEGSGEIGKFVSNGNSKPAEKTTFEGVIERMNDNDVERDLRDALLSPSKLFKGRRSIHVEESENEVDKMMEDFVSDESAQQALTKTPKSARKALKNLDGTPLGAGKSLELVATPKSIAKTPKSSGSVTKTSETPKSVKKMSENADRNSPPITGTPKNAPKTPKSSEIQKLTPKSTGKELEVTKTPKSASKVSLSSVTTPKAAESSPAGIKTPKSVKKTPESVVLAPETPLSAKKAAATPNGNAMTPKTDKHSMTPKSVQKTDKTPQKTPKSSETVTVKTPKSKETPKSTRKNDSRSEISLGNDEMDITAKSSDMEISPSSPTKFQTSRISPVKTDMKSVPIETMQRRTWSQSVRNDKQDSPVHRHSFAEYLENITKSSEKRKSMAKEATEVVMSDQRSWTHSVRKSGEGAIDAVQVNTAPEVIKASPRKSKPISSDESDDDHETNKFVDDEAEVGSEGESITESERNYLLEHEIPVTGELIGSEDSDGIDDEEEEEEESDSFIDDNDELSNSYDMDSDEEKIELSQEKKKTRIIPPSSSEDEEEVEEKGSAKKSKKIIEDGEEIDENQKNLEEIDENQVESEKEEIAEVPKSKKRKRDSIVNESIIETKKKRAKLNSSANGSEAMHMEDLSEKTEVLETEPRKEKLKKVKKDLFEPKSIVSVIDKCNAMMSAHQKEKKQKMSLKREKRALKLAKKLEEKQADSSNGENKENAPKKKKKKAKKQKLVESELKNLIWKEITFFIITQTCQSRKRTWRRQ